MKRETSDVKESFHLFYTFISVLNTLFFSLTPFCLDTKRGKKIKKKANAPLPFSSFLTIDTPINSEMPHPVYYGLDYVRF